MSTKTYEGRDVEEQDNHLGEKIVRMTPADWTCSAEEFNDANAEDEESVTAADALAVGESCWLGGGAAPLTLVTRVK